MQRPLIGVTLIAAATLALPVQATPTAPPFLGPSTVTTGGFFYRYDGPLGAGIFNDGTNPIVGRETSWFRDRGAGTAARFDPTTPYEGYEATQFAGSGTGSVSLSSQVLPNGQQLFWTGSQGVDFYLKDQGQALDVNSLVITGTETQGVEIDPSTGKSGPIKLATFSFTNGTWYSVSPPNDPGLGSLYPESAFQFSLIATPDPFIGSSGFPGYHVFNGTLLLVTTFGPNTADYLVLPGLPAGAPSILAVDEGITGTVDLWGRIGSLEPLEFRNPSSGVQILSEIPTTPIPEPSTYLQMLLGIGALVAGRKAMRRP